MNDLIFFSSNARKGQTIQRFLLIKVQGDMWFYVMPLLKYSRSKLTFMKVRDEVKKTQFLGTKNLSVISEQNAKASRGWPIDVLSAFGGHQHIAKDCNILTSEFIYIIRGRYSVEDWGSCTARKVTSNGNFFQSYHNYIEFLIIYSVMDIF